jgi:hypothetical protein
MIFGRVKSVVDRKSYEFKNVVRLSSRKWKIAYSV